MDAGRLNDLHKKASDFLEESVRVLKGGFKEAGRLINVTADATKIHIEKEQRLIALHRDYHRLGVEMYRQLQGKTVGSTCTLATETWELVERIRLSEKDIERHQEMLNRFTVVSAPKGSSAPKAPRRKTARTGRGTSSKSVRQKMPHPRKPSGNSLHK